MDFDSATVECWSDLCITSVVGSVRRQSWPVLWYCCSICLNWLS